MMEVLDRHYKVHGFKYDGLLEKQTGGYAGLNYGITFQDTDTVFPYINMVYQLSLNNFDASLLFEIECLSKVILYDKKPNAKEVFEEFNLFADAAYKKLVKHCTKIGKPAYPDKPNLEEKKEEMLLFIQSVIDAIYP